MRLSIDNRLTLFLFAKRNDKGEPLDTEHMVTYIGLIPVIDILAAYEPIISKL
jgi:hypothetical protein